MPVSFYIFIVFLYCFFVFPHLVIVTVCLGVWGEKTHLQKLSTDIKYNLIYHKMVTLHDSAFLKPKK